MNKFKKFTYIAVITLLVFINVIFYVFSGKEDIFLSLPLILMIVLACGETLIVKKINNLKIKS